MNYIPNARGLPHNGSIGSFELVRQSELQNHHTGCFTFSRDDNIYSPVVHVSYSSINAGSSCDGYPANDLGSPP